MHLISGFSSKRPRAARPGRIAACATIAALALATPLSGHAASGGKSGTCTAADTAGVLAGITGDYQLTNDPSDPQGSLIFTANTTGSVLATQNVVVAKVDGTTGNIVPGSLTTIANNFYGNSFINGPEWFYSPQGNLGVIYPAAGGLALALRSATPSAWNAFGYDYSGAPT
ncbi:MAG: hypothetical protein JSR21_22305, partial [Proteobacteria bacterium]|nr:hypothetical protein [Pseudomonadota bacterium]